jgi:hypothetical protein
MGDDRYININEPPLLIQKKHGTYLAATCMRLHGYSLEYALSLLVKKSTVKNGDKK